MININYSITVATSLLLTLSSTAYATQDSITFGARSSLTLTPVSSSDPVSAQSFVESDLRLTKNTSQETQQLFSRVPNSDLVFRSIGTTKGFSNKTSFDYNEANRGSNHRGFDPEFGISAGLPHLRMDLRVTSVELNGPLTVPAGDFVIKTYLNSDAHVENAWGAGYVPTFATPGSDNGTIMHDMIILSALVFDGCKDSTVIKVLPVWPISESENSAILYSTWTDGDVNSVALEDSVQGPGFYEFSFSIDGVDGAQYIIRGEAPVYCTAATEPLPLG